MPASGNRYDFDDSMLRELHAAQARLGARHPARPAAGGGRRPGRLLLAGVGVGALTTAAVAVSVTALGAHSPSAPATAGPVASTETDSFVTARLSASLGREAGYMITSHVTQNKTGEKLTSWIDPATGNRRLLLTSAAGTPEIAEGIVVRGANAIVTTVDYAARSVTTATESIKVIGNAARLGVNVPSPSVIRSELGSATLVSEGQAEIGGHRTYRLRMTVPPRSQAWFPGDDIELYVDTSTYQLVRTTISRNGTRLDTDDLTWTPRGTANLSQTRVTIPAGFTKR